ncbi:MAG: helix-turn-helix domain-containing protein [Candidatus Jettenia sp.]|uniref:HTH cro/C1-type domain-containing protein n=1 Tax=Candidatus Jettenia caeni TaxID=247490 RepID=I3IGW3_9BACT|nr:helix-turn-helix domain-containing protein [Candidatus Jettenia sp. AMX1]MBC6929692.1 helix-turn-helix domain-containing protein [Candidatus Jettenia sp.]NUN22647.1 helix-turn-helix domain-containing protein [Candidatus Jettenia caeni]KAA0248946.1 MAG: helix-turn-helix domain-containing protein [Candidatus Jettenia sp. AMX1]MCE7881260.1 helix-turn-helix domain-containing protein [Candidatus Jettenia sp. AMX1]MCQ3928101.1 helix-turn-helix domain-containing protein [Candidatus Jettenia sp.]
MISSKEIKELREKLGATQTEFAKALGISFSTVSRWESGQAQPTDTQEEQLDALKQLLENQDIDERKLKKMLGLMGIGGVIATAIIAGFTISTPWGAAMTSLIKKSTHAGKILDLFKKNKKPNKTQE